MSKDEVIEEDELGAEEEVSHEEPVEDLAEDDGKDRQFPCHQCGAFLQWKPGAKALSCQYCGHTEELPQDERSIQEFAFNDYIVSKGKASGLGTESRTLQCQSCAAQVELAADEAAHVCPFCGSNAIDEAAHEERIAPEGIIPFAVEREAARTAFRNWLKKLWFAPNDLKKTAYADTFQGLYRPWWTFDSHTYSHWSGQAGYYYYVTKTRVVNGKTQTYRVRKTRWKYRSGTYEAFFDDTLTQGFHDDINAEEYGLHAVVPHDSKMIAGYLCERYTIDPQGAWPHARSDMESEIRTVCKGKLGGDTQRGLTVSTAHSGITFKSILLPAWHSAYRYKGKVFQIAVNGQNAKVTAQRPYSWIKITLAVLCVLLLVAGLVIMFNR